VTIGGILPVIQTPFDDSDTVDLPALARLVAFAVASGASGIVYPANASEFHTLTVAERQVAIMTVFEAAGGLPVIACVTDSALDQTRAFARQAGDLGAAAVMALPTYQRPGTTSEVIDYFVRGVSDAGVPVVLQNVGPPNATPLDDSTLDNLLEAVPEIEYIKEERTPTTQRITQLVDRYDGRLRGVIGGANGQWLVQEALRGAIGCMPAGALVDLQVPIQQAVESGDWDRARTLQARLQPLLSYTSIYGLPVIKEILKMRGLAPNVRTRDPAMASLDSADRLEIRRYLTELDSLEIPHD
jgi:dihydrodipicolinate synthase/N-acetylneuraminate lyase